MLPGGVAAPIRLPLLLLLLLLHCGRGAVQVRKVWWKAEALHSEHQLREATQVLLQAWWQACKAEGRARHTNTSVKSRHPFTEASSSCSAPTCTCMSSM